MRFWLRPGKECSILNLISTTFHSVVLSLFFLSLFFLGLLLLEASVLSIGRSYNFKYHFVFGNVWNKLSILINTCCSSMTIVVMLKDDFTALLVKGVSMNLSSPFTVLEWSPFIILAFSSSLFHTRSYKLYIFKSPCQIISFIILETFENG